MKVSAWREGVTRGWRIKVSFMMAFIGALFKKEAVFSGSFGQWLSQQGFGRGFYDQGMASIGGRCHWRFVRKHNQEALFFTGF